MRRLAARRSASEVVCLRLTHHLLFPLALSLLALGTVPATPCEHASAPSQLTVGVTGRVWVSVMYVTLGSGPNER